MPCSGSGKALYVTDFGVFAKRREKNDDVQGATDKGLAW